MKIYATSRNTGPSWNSDPVRLLYIGTSLEEAIEAVGIFVRYEDSEFPKTYPKIYSALPEHIDFAFEKWYGADGWWHSVVSFELFERVSS